jgi:MtN3 and saliva related transmembrane protein
MNLPLFYMWHPMQIDANLIGYCAAVLTTGAFVPQTIKTIRSRDTRAISLWMYAAFVAGIAFWFVYGLTLGSWPVILSNAITFLLAVTILAMKVRYG